MLGKIIRGILLVLLIAFYARNVYYSGGDWLNAVIYNRVNFIVLVAILFLASYFARVFGTLCMLVLAGGILFHGYMYYSAYAGSNRSGNTTQAQTDKCHGEGSTWYSRLNDNCY